jgi:hypothetical protein
MHARHQETGAVVPLEFSLEFIGRADGGCLVAVEGVSTCRELCVEGICFDAPNDFGNLDMALSWIVFSIARHGDKWNIATDETIASGHFNPGLTSANAPSLGGSVVLGCLSSVLLPK